MLDRHIAPRPLGGVFLVLGALLFGGPASATTGEGTEVIVRIDDRDQRALLQPWVSVQAGNNEVLRMPVFDNGSDPLDRYAGDRFYIGRVEVGGEGTAQIYVTDGGPVGVGRSIYQGTIKLRPGKVERVRVGTVPQPSSSNVMIAPSDLGSSPNNGGMQGPGGGQQTTQVDDSDLPWMEEPFSFEEAQWEWRPWLGLAGLGLLLLWSRRSIRRATTSVSRQLQLVGTSLERAAARPARLRRQD